MKIIWIPVFISIISMHIFMDAMELHAQKNQTNFNIVTVQSKDPRVEYEIWELPNNEFDQDTITFTQKKFGDQVVTISAEIYTANNQICTQKNTISEIEFVLDNPYEALEQNRELFELDIEEPCHVYRDEEYRKQQTCQPRPQLASQLIHQRKIRPSYKPKHQSWAYYILNALLNSD